MDDIRDPLLIRTLRMTEKAHASPTKNFFISMITKDIAVEDCVFDLLDNAIDGARSDAARLSHADSETKPGAGSMNAQPYTDYWVRIDFNDVQFRISDNCGGITVDDAINYAFHFGRRKGAAEVEGSIGLYGIGMKRAMFKIGRKITVKSSTADEGFEVPIDVAEWAQDKAGEDPNSLTGWDFDLKRVTKGDIGTEITITDLHPGIRDEFADQSFLNNLVRTIARDYSLFLQRGFAILVNNQRVIPYEFQLLEGAAFEPVRFQYDDEGVTVEIWAGLSKALADDDGADVPVTTDVEYFGWFVACNDRIVLAGNKNERTVWGDPTDRFNSWHPQYNGFLGFAAFTSSNPVLLPYTTTKRDVDTAMPVYRRAVARMKIATRQFIDYTNSRKASLETENKPEEKATLKPIGELPVRTSMKVPSYARRSVANVSYAVPMAHYQEAAKSFGDPHMSRKEVGLRTFAYHRAREVEPR